MQKKDSLAELRTVFRLRRAFSKPLVTIDAIAKLVKLARSPNMNRILEILRSGRCTIPRRSKGPTLPDSPTVWKQRFSLMGIAGTRYDVDQNDQKNLSTCIEQSRPEAHLEVNILSYLHKEGDELYWI